MTSLDLELDNKFERLIASIKSVQVSSNAPVLEVLNYIKSVQVSSNAPVSCSNAPVLEVLNRNNYEKWRLRVKTYLLAEDLWEVVEAIRKPTPNRGDDDPEDKAWKRTNAKALYAIQNSCGPEMFSFISKTESAKKAWEALEQECKIFQVYDENNADHLESLKSFNKSVQSGDWDKAKKCLGEIDIRSVVLRTVDGWREGTITLHVAAKKGHGHIVKELVHLMSQEDLKTKTSLGHTALHLAAGKGHVHVVKELPVLWMGEVKDKDGDTALHIAVQKGKVAIVKELVLLMREEDLKIKNHDGYTALHLAVNKGDMPMLKEFVRKDEDENHMDDFDPYIPFTDCVNNGDWEQANYCLRRLDNPCGAATAVDTRDDWGDTALHIAAQQGHLDVIRGLVLMLKKREEDLELKTDEDFISYGSGTSLEVGEELLMERAKYMVEQWEKTLGRILELQNTRGFTPLHIAVVGRNMDIVRELMPLTRPKAFEEKDGEGQTTLTGAIIMLKDGEICELAKHMAEKNDKVFGIPAGPDDEIPVVLALRQRRWEVARYIYSLTPLELIDGPNGSAFICYCLDTGKQLDLAWDLLHRHSNLAITLNKNEKTFPMLKLSRMCHAFLSRTQLTRAQRWIYNRIHIGEVAQVNIRDVSISVAPSEDDHGNQMNFFSSVINLFKIYAEGFRKLCGIDDIHEIKLAHKRAYDILQCMAKVTKDDLSKDQLDMVKTSFFKAIQHGHFEFVTQICEADPQVLNKLDGEDRKVKGIFHSAIESRQKEVYSLIYGLDERERRDIGLYIVNKDYNLLHYAANLSTLQQFDHIQDAALHMQRELQWFKEVESVVPPERYEYRDRRNDMTARELFTKNHSKLMEDAEISIKGTASSCTVVGALIITMMFAAAFIVPGGDNGNTGIPLNLDKKLFKVYIVSDTISLVSSTSSVITFLGILTSRYAENDFLKSLPTKMMIGLITLFSSIVSMMIAFSCALIIQLGGELWIVMLSILLTSLPVILFIWLLFPLLYKSFMSTYGPEMFNKKKKC